MWDFYRTVSDVGAFFPSLISVSCRCTSFARYMADFSWGISLKNYCCFSVDLCTERPAYGVYMYGMEKTYGVTEQTNIDSNQVLFHGSAKIHPHICVYPLFLMRKQCTTVVVLIER